MTSGMVLKLHDVGAADLGASVEARHRLVLDDHALRHAEAVELGAHGAAVSPEHADFDIIAGPNVARKLERSRHLVDVVAGRPEEAEFRGASFRRRLPQQAYRIAPADMRRIEQRAIGAVVDVELGAAALFDAHDEARIFGTERATGLTPQFRRIADRQGFEAGMNYREIILQRRRLHARIDGGKTAAD